MGVTRVTEEYVEVALDASDHWKTRVTDLYVEVAISNTPQTGHSTGTYTVAIDLNDDGDFVDTNEDASDYVTSIHVEHGGADPITGETLIAAATVIVKNNDGRFSPTNTASPLYPNFKKGRKIQIQTVLNGVTYVRGTLRITDIKPSMARADRTCTIEAEGLLAGLRDAPVKGRDWQGKNLKTILTDLVTDGGWDGPINVDVTGDAPPYIDIPAGQGILGVLSSIAETEGGRFYELPDSTFRYEERHYRRRAEQTVYATFDRDWIEGTMTMEDSIRPEEATAVRVTVAPLAAGPLQEVWRVQQGGIWIPKNNAASPVVLFAEFDNQVINLQAPSFANEDLAANYADGSADASASISVTVTQQGRRARIQVVNSHATKNVRLGHLRLRGQPIITSEDFSGVALSAEAEAKRHPTPIRMSFEADVASDLGVIPIEVTPFYASSSTFAQALAVELQARRSTPRKRFTFTLTASELADLIVLYDLQVSQRLRLIHTDAHQIDVQVWVDRIVEDWEPFKPVRFTVETIEVEANQSVWRLGQAALNTNPTLVTF